MVSRALATLVALSALVSVAALAPTAARAQAFTITQPVTDRAGVLSISEIDTVINALVAYRDATGIQLAVVLVDRTDGVPIDDYAQRLFDAWGGGSAERNDGALFVLAIKDRANRLHLGYGLEGHISDSRAVGMLIDLRPSLRAGDYARACLELIEAMRSATRDITPDAPITIPWPRAPRSAAIVLLLAILATVLTWRLAFPERFSAAKRVYAARLARASAKATARTNRGFARDAADKAFKAAMTRAGRIQLGSSYAVLLLLVPLVLGLVTAGPVGSFVAYPALWLTGCALAGLGVLVWRRRPIGRWFWMVLVGLLLAAFVGGPTDQVIDGGGELFGACLALLGLVAFFSMFWLIDGSGGGGGSYSSSSRSSSSSWSSSSSYSSSSSSTSWSGGGGSSGGGGASSSW